MIVASIFSKLVVGFCVLFILLSIFGGGPATAFAIIALSVICTAGFGLIIIIPVSLALGAVTFWLVNLFRKSKSTPEQKGPTKEEVALETYISQARQKDISDKDIYLRLREKGWDEAQIIKAIGVKPISEVSTQPVKKGMGIYIAFGAIVLIVAAIYILNSSFGSSSQAKNEQYDQQRVNDIYNLKYSIESYYGNNSKLPATLGDLTLSSNTYTLDPVTNQPYQYSSTSQTAYRLCAYFDSSSSSVGQGSTISADQTYSHPQGYYCYNLQISNNMIKNSTNLNSGNKSVLESLLPNTLRCYSLRDLGTEIKGKFISAVSWPILKIKATLEGYVALWFTHLTTIAQSLLSSSSM